MLWFRNKWILSFLWVCNFVWIIKSWFYPSWQSSKWGFKKPIILNKLFIFIIHNCGYWPVAYWYCSWRIISLKNCKTYWWSCLNSRSGNSFQGDYVRLCVYSAITLKLFNSTLRSKRESFWHLNHHAGISRNSALGYDRNQKWVS
jgi:hypothetical protein